MRTSLIPAYAHTIEIDETGAAASPPEAIVTHATSDGKAPHRPLGARRNVILPNLIEALRYE